MKVAKKKSAKKKSPVKQSARARETVQRAGTLVARAANRRGEIPQVKDKDRGWYVRELERLRWKERVYGANGFRERLEAGRERQYGKVLASAQQLDTPVGIEEVVHGVVV